MTRKNSYTRMLALALFAVIAMASSSWAASYYVDSVSGSDVNAGTQAAPWKTVAKVNGTALAAGDTVYFKAGGTWTGTLTPVSGNSSADVTYTSYGTGGKPILDSANMPSKSYITISGLVFNAASVGAVTITGGSHITLKNCEMYNVSTNTSWCVLRIGSYSSYVKVINCKLSNECTSVQDDCLSISHSNYNLVDGCTILNATHYALTVEGANATHPTDTANYNVIRNNTINNSNGANAEFQSLADWNVITGNTLIGTYAGKFDAAPNTMKVVSANNIVRMNVLRDNTQTTSYGLESIVYQYNSDPPNNAVNNRIYNNVITNIYNNPLVLDNYQPSTCSVSNNVYKNNILYNNGVPNGYQLMVAPASSNVVNNTFSTNIFFKSGVTNVLKINGSGVSVAGAQSNDPSHYYGNLQKDPMLDSTQKPMSGSPCIDAGDFLTKVTSASGSGTVLTVADARYFSTGNGLVTGDTIMIGKSTATVQSINYSTNTITLVASATWNSGDPVSLPYSGSRPDIGAYETAPTTTALSAPTGLSVN